MRIVLATITTLLLSLSAAFAQAECLDSNTLQTLNHNEMTYMLARIPPAFSDAVADKKITSRMYIATSETCKVNFEVTLPESDVQEAEFVTGS